jgi:alpha/beta superfamily hydrolase
VLAGPHPLLGGTLNNNVVRALGDGLAERGVATLRFNYRGVGSSEGPSPGKNSLAEFWLHSRVSEEKDFRDDFVGAMAFLRSLLGPEMPLALVGYSFGCSLLPHELPAKDNVALVLVAPTVGRHDLDAFTDLAHPKLVVAPEGDFAVDREQLNNWFARLRQPKQLVTPTWDGHFFRQHEKDLVDVVAPFLANCWR